jgi:hypothetical protein
MVVVGGGGEAVDAAAVEWLMGASAAEVGLGSADVASGVTSWASEEADGPP